MRHRQGLELSDPEGITQPWDLSRLLEAECTKWEMEILGRRNNSGNNKGPRVKKGSLLSRKIRLAETRTACEEKLR